MALHSFGPPSRTLVDYHMGWGGMPLHDEVGLNCKRGAPTENQGKVPVVWAKGCEFDVCMSVI